MDIISAFRVVISYRQVAAVITISLIVVYGFTRVMAMYLSRRELRRRKTSCIELTPPVRVNTSPDATAQLFAVIHGARHARSRSDILLGRNPVMSFEIVSTRAEGIRYLVQVDSNNVAAMYAALIAYLPEAKVREVEAPDMSGSRVVGLTQSCHYVLPLKAARPAERHDPLAYLTAAMANLDLDEQIIVQLITTPTRPKDVATWTYRLLRNEDVLQQARAKRRSYMGRLLGVVGTVIVAVTQTISESLAQASSPSSGRYGSGKVLSKPQGIDTPARTLSSFEQELLQTMQQKLEQQLFEVTMRLVVKSPLAGNHLASLRSALDGYSVPSYQSLRVRRSYFGQARVLYYAQQRLPATRKSGRMILSSVELAGLFHVPSSSISATDNLIGSHSRTLPAPVSLKSGRDLSVLLGENKHHGITTSIGLTAAERERHLYVVGGTGNGKTTMLFYSILQDITNGRGVGVIDPHGDLAERLLRYVPESRIADVIYLNPDDLSYPIGINLLELSPDLTGDDLLREKDLITEAVISVLRKTFSDDDSGGHRIEYILRNTIHTALTLEGATLFTIFELLNDAKYRRKVVAGLQNKHLKDFWVNEIGKAGEYQRVKMSAGITAKIGRFLFSASARRMMEQPRSTINFDDILTGHKILICNFSKGKLGEDTASLFGTAILAMLQTAALRRARINETNRTPFYLYVDEFQNFATIGFVQMLSEARKYKLFLTMAEQSTAQQEQQRLVEVILANVGTVVCFRSGSPADERLLLPLFYPSIETGEIVNLPAYSYYLRIAAVDAQEPMSGETVVVVEEGSELRAQHVIKSSRSLYAIDIYKDLVSPVVAVKKVTGMGSLKRSVKTNPNTVPQRDAI